MAALVAPLLRRAWRRPTRVLLSRSRSGSARRAQHSVAVPAAAAAMAAAPAVLRSGEDVAAWLAQLPEGGSPPAAEAAAGATTVRCTGRVTACRRNKAATFCDVELSAATADAGASPAAGDAPPATVQLVLQRGRLAADEQRADHSGRNDRRSRSARMRPTRWALAVRIAAGAARLRCYGGERDAAG
jgi:hypothetical protein